MTHGDSFDVETTPTGGGDPLAGFGEAPPAFALLDDAGGRFVIDAESGVVSLAHEDVFARERDAIHSVRIRVVEPGGARYEITMRLQITGMVPRMAGDDFFGDFAASEPPAPTATNIAQPQPIEPAPFSAEHWLRYAAFAGRPAQHRTRAQFSADFGAGLPAHVAPHVSAGRAELTLPAVLPAMPDSWLQDDAFPC